MVSRKGSVIAVYLTVLDPTQYIQEVASVWGSGLSGADLKNVVDLIPKDKLDLIRQYLEKAAHNAIVNYLHDQASAKNITDPNICYIDRIIFPCKEVTTDAKGNLMVHQKPHLFLFL